MNNKIISTSQVRGEQVANQKYQIIKLGLDVHAQSIRVVRILDHAAPQPAQRMTPADFLKWAAKQLALADKVCSCYEAGPCGYVLHRKLAQMGIENLVVRPQVLDDYGTKVKTDKTDALALAQRLERYLQGNPKALAVVRVPTEAEEQKRIVTRQREQLRKERQRLAAQGRSLLLYMGFRFPGIWWKPTNWEKLTALVPAWLEARLKIFRDLILQFNQQLDQATAAIEAVAPAQLPRGLGGLTFEILQREVGDWHRFDNRRQIGSYTGLCAGVNASGNSCWMLSITKHGNARLRAALIELAWRMVVWQSQCRAVQKWKHLLLNPKATVGARKKAIVALARQLAIDLWRWQTGKVTPEALGWIMNG